MLINCPVPRRPSEDDQFGVGPSVSKVRLPVDWERADSATKEAVESAQSDAEFDPLMR